MSQVFLGSSTGILMYRLVTHRLSPETLGGTRLGSLATRLTTRVPLAAVRFQLKGPKHKQPLATKRPQGLGFRTQLQQPSYPLRRTVVVPISNAPICPVDAPSGTFLILTNGYK